MRPVSGWGRIPFSRRGRFTVVSLLPVEKPGAGRAWYVRCVCGGEIGYAGRMFRIGVVDNRAESDDFSVSHVPGRLEFSASGGRLSFAIGAGETLLVEGEGLGLRLTRRMTGHDCAAAVAPGRWRVLCGDLDLHADIALRRGNAGDISSSGASTWSVDLLPCDGMMSAELNIFRAVFRPCEQQTAARCAADARRDFTRWRNAWTAARAGSDAAAEEAAYVLWANSCPAHGLLTRPGIYASKGVMSNMWAWDNCFMARALARAHPRLALDQLMVFFDHQSDSGRIPDTVNSRSINFSFTKPPVHGWTLEHLMRVAPAFYAGKGRLSSVAEALTKWTEYWRDHAKMGRRGLPAYMSGNDSGWDNASVFASEEPVASPDLLAYLVLQAEFLAKCFARLGDAKRSEAWGSQAAEWLKALLAEFWCDGRFIARNAISWNPIESGDSLLLFMPLLLARRLPAKVRRSLIDGLRKPGRFLGARGLSTEARASGQYRAEGYWLGPVWAPPTLLLIRALDDCGEKTMAGTIASRFVAMCRQSGMAENFNPETGAAQCDEGFSWTAAVNLELSDEKFLSAGRYAENTAAPVGV